MTCRHGISHRSEAFSWPSYIQNANTIAYLSLWRVGWCMLCYNEYILSFHNLFFKLTLNRGKIRSGLLRSLTRVWLWGGHSEPPLSFFLNICQTNRDTGTKLAVPSGTSIWHILTKQQFRTYHRSAGNDTRVMSCLIDFGAKWESLSRAQFVS